MPVFNEENLVVKAIKEVVKTKIYGFKKELIIVDDGSTDKTYKNIRSYKRIHVSGKTAIKIVKKSRNMGKGAAIRSGVKVATGQIIIIQDADLEYSPKEIVKLIKPIKLGYADVVYGSRFMGGAPHRVLFFWHMVANKLLTLISNSVTNLNLTDMETGYKAFKSSVIKKIQIRENRFGFEPEITAKIAKLNCRVYEVGISYKGRKYDQGKKINWKDGFWALWCILRYNLL